MKHPGSVLSYSIIGGLVLALTFTVAAPSARANVFASNVKINGGIRNVSVAPGASVSISYILNEPASAGVIIKILSGATAVRTVSLAGGSAGTLRGTNLVVWDGKNDANVNVPEANYSVSIRAASLGYDGWTKITDDDNEGNYVYEARGIAVDRNTNSAYYGRVFVGNAFDHSSQGTSPYHGDYLGIQKLNADGSYADEGGFSDGGISWRDSNYAPWKIRVSEDDYVYVEDWLINGDIYRFDGAISSASRLLAFAAPTDGSQGSVGGFCVVGKGTNTMLWAADASVAGSQGVKKFPVRPDGTFGATNGVQVVALGGSPGLTSYPFAVALDQAGAIYTLQSPSFQGDSSARAFRFPAYDPATNGGAPELRADWVAGPGDDYSGGHGIAVDPTGTYVAACFWGYFNTASATWTSGNLKILKAADGTVVTNLDLGAAYPNSRTADPTRHQDTDADWDAVGNLYYLDNWAICWRAFSPPGANQATTLALPVVQVASPVQPPDITSIGVSGGTVTIHFTGGSNDPAAMYSLLSAPVVSGPYSPAAGAVITGPSGGAFMATVPASGPRQFYRIVRLASIPIEISNLSVAGGTVTINFSGAPSDPPSAFALLSSATANGTYSSAAGAIITQIVPGRFQATVPTSGPRQFYRIGK